MKQISEHSISKKNVLQHTILEYILLFYVLLQIHENIAYRIRFKQEWPTISGSRASLGDFRSLSLLYTVSKFLYCGLTKLQLLISYFTIQKVECNKKLMLRCHNQQYPGIKLINLQIRSQSTKRRTSTRIFSKSKVTSSVDMGVPHESTLGPLQFLIHTSN